jgi:hypothetical protein
MRDLTRIYLITKELVSQKHGENSIKSFADCFNPMYFDNMFKAALQLAGYDQTSGTVGVPSIAYRLSQPIRDVCEMLMKSAMEKFQAEPQKTLDERLEIVKLKDFLFQLFKLNGKRKS